MIHTHLPIETKRPPALSEATTKANGVIPVRLYISRSSKENEDTKIQIPEEFKLGAAEANLINNLVSLAIHL